MNSTSFNSPQRRYVSNSTESVRMFRYDWMEALSKVHWSAPLYVFVPAVVAALAYSVRVDGLGMAATGLWFLAGLAVWTLAEYLLHRFLFHYVPKPAWAQRLHFIFHGVHHDYPSDARRLVMPPTVSVPIALLFYGLFWWMLPGPAVEACFAGFGVGYLSYDMLHYAVHHVQFKQAWLKALKRNHMQHHFADPTRGYGVSSPFWDVVFRTTRLTRRPGKDSA